MQVPKLNILVRTGNRKELFSRCLKSITDQHYPNIRIIVSIDRDCDYIPNGIEAIRVQPHPELPYGYDLYCNSLKELVTDGHFLFLDDDDVLAPDCLAKLDLSHPAILVQVNHMNNVIPVNGEVMLGRVGMPCLILHHSLKNISDVPGNDHNDYHWIKAVSEQVELNFQPIIVVVCDQKGNGI